MTGCVDRNGRAASLVMILNRDVRVRLQLNIAIARSRHNRRKGGIGGICGERDRASVYFGRRFLCGIKRTV